MDFHAILEIPKGDKHPQFKQLPELESFARSDRERKLVNLGRAFRIAGTPIVLPPGTPKERVEILQEAFRTTYKTQNFSASIKSLLATKRRLSCPKIMKGQSKKFLAILK